MSVIKFFFNVMYLTLKKIMKQTTQAMILTVFQRSFFVFSESTKKDTTENKYLKLEYNPANSNKQLEK